MNNDVFVFSSFSVSYSNGVFFFCDEREDTSIIYEKKQFHTRSVGTKVWIYEHASNSKPLAIDFGNADSVHNFQTWILDCKSRMSDFEFLNSNA